MMQILLLIRILVFGFLTIHQGAAMIEPQMKIAVKLQFSFGSQIASIADDSFIPGNLLIATSSRVVLTASPELPTIQHLVAGSVYSDKTRYREGVGSNATFGHIETLTPLNDTHLVVVDSFFSCLRLINRKLNRTSLLAGRCRSKSDQIGRFLEARFNEPVGMIIQDYRGYLVDSFNYAIKLLDFSTGNVSMLVDGLQYPSGKISFAENSLFIPTQFGLQRVNLSEDTLAFKPIPFKEQGMNETCVNVSLRFVRDIMTLNNSHLIVTTKTKVMILDLESSLTATLCDNSINATCRIVNPGWVTLSGPSLIIAQYGFGGKIYDFRIKEGDRYVSLLSSAVASAGPTHTCKQDLQTTTIWTDKVISSTTNPETSQFQIDYNASLESSVSDSGTRELTSDGTSSTVPFFPLFPIGTGYLDIPLIVGLVVGLVVGVAVLSAVVYVVSTRCKRSRKKSSGADYDDFENPSDDRGLGGPAYNATNGSISLRLNEQTTLTNNGGEAANIKYRRKDM